MSEVADADSHLWVNRRIVRNTVAVNYLGLCAITMPVEGDSAGMRSGSSRPHPPMQKSVCWPSRSRRERVLGTAANRLRTPPLLTS